MVDIMDAGRSGLLAYREALGVTGQNIANVDTPGYRRRDAMMREVGPGAGVDVVDIRRAFDALMAGRSRNAQSGVGAAETALSHLRALEDRLLPGDGGLPDLLDGFFDALDGLSLMPSDAGLRHAVLNAGHALAGGVADLALGLEALAQGVTDETAQAVERVNMLLKGLADVQDDLARSPDAEARNPLLDRRDSLLGELATHAEIDVTLDDRGRATVRLGSGDGGPLLLKEGRAGQFEQEPNGTMMLRTAEMGAPRVQATPSGGVLGGLRAAGGAIAQAMDDLDGWALTLAEEMNTVHAAGRDADGQAGGPLFSLSGWSATPGALMRGTARVEVTITDAAQMPGGPVQLVHDATAGEWQARNAAGAVLGAGVGEIALPGLTITLTPGALDGDRITLDRRDDAARNLAFLPGAPADIAAGGAISVTPAAENTGMAGLQVRSVAQTASEFTDLSGILGSEPIEFYESGVVGVIPAGAESAELSAHHRRAVMDLSWPSGLEARSLTLTYPAGTVQQFDPPPELDAGALTAALNAGTLRSVTGQSLSDLGLVAQLEGGGLSLQAVSGDLPDAATLETDTGTTSYGLVVSTAAEAAALSVFTREGRQLSGAPLTPAEAAALIVPVNGFNAGATYSTDYLDGAAPYGGLSVAPTTSGTGLRMGNLPEEDLLVVMSGPGALRLSGQITEGPAQPRTQELRVLDAATGRVGLFDAVTGAHLASRTLDATGSAEFNGVAITLGAGAATGDVYTLSPQSVGAGDSRTVEALANLRQRDGQTGAGGYGQGFASLQQRVGVQVSAAESGLFTARAESESAARAESDLGGVDLDAEAARLMQHQQAYQANAQVLSVARSLFDTLMQAL